MKARETYAYWPIRLGWQWRDCNGQANVNVTRWGWQIGPHRFGHTVRVGPLLVKFGRLR